MSFYNKMCLTIFISLVLVLSSHAQNSPQDYVDAHNAARADVGVDPISWDDTVATYAQNYASSRGGDCNLVHSGGPYGENLATGSSSGDSDFITGVDAVNLWVGEKQFYDHGSNSCIGGQQCLHYTQVVWSGSTTLGCARTPCNDGGWYVICSYNPPGNVQGQSAY